VNRPTSVTVFAVLNIVFGTLGVICTPFALVYTFFAPQMQGFYANAGIASEMSTNAFEMMQTPAYQTFMIVSTLLGTLVSALLIAAGIGLLKLRPWARWISIGYAVYAVLSLILGQVVSYFLITKPLLENIGSGPERMGMVGGLYGGMIGSVCWLIYPVVLLIFMLLPSVKAAFRQDQIAPLPPEYQPPPLP
jgi:hypothetical protein